jgi:dolichol-phosphate mannosyltransferase
VIGGWISGPLVDLISYFIAIGAGAPSGRSQVVSFGIALGLCYGPHMISRARSRGRIWDSSLALHLITITLLALFMRGGVFALLTSRWGWSGSVAIVFTAAATAGVIRPAYEYCISSAKWSLGFGTDWRIGAVAVIVFAWLLRVIYGAQVELLPEETYYWNYSRHLDIGYLDHPPMVGWLIRAGTLAFGDTEFGVRAGALCAGGVAGLFTYRLTRNLFGEASALVALLLMQVLPFFFLTGMLMTPDAPLMAAWAAAIYFLERALIGERAAAWWGAGLCFGLGLLSKYTIGFLGLSTLIFMLLDSRSRRWFRRGEPYGAALLAFAIFSPVIIWNARNGWASFAFQTSRRLADRPRFELHKLILSALILLTPTGLAAAGVLLLRPTPSAGTDLSMDQMRGWRFLRLTILVPLSVFAVFSLRHEVKLDWTGAPWIGAVPALAFGTVRSGEGLLRGLRAWIRGAWVPTILLLLVIYGTGLYYLVFGIPGLGYTRHAELVPVGWRDLATQINHIADDTYRVRGQYPLIIGMDRYAIASELAFYAPDSHKAVNETSSAHLFGQVGLMYERWFPPRKQEGRTLLLVAWDRSDLAGSRIESSVERPGRIQEGVVTRNGEPVRPFYFRLADGYRGAAAPE